MNKLIKLSDTHYIVVDDSEIKVNDWITDGKRIAQVNVLTIDDPNKHLHKAITHSTQPLGIGWQQEVIELSLSEVEEAVYGYSVEKMADEKYPYKLSSGARRAGFVDGFKTHQELAKDKLFTVDDIRKAYTAGWMNRLNNEETYINGFNKFIESLLPKTEWDIEFDKNGKIKLL